MSRIMVDVETGEKYDLASFTTVEQQLAYKEVKDKEERLSKSENPFFFAEMDEVKGKELTKLDNKNLGWFLILQTYVDYKNMLRLPNAKLPMKPLEIRRALKITDSRTFKTLQAKLEELELIYTKDVEMYGKTYTAFFINDKYCFKTGLHGEYKNRKTNKAVKFFINTLQEVYSQEKVNSGDVGLIYKAIQHLHYNSNILVQTPSEMDEAFVKPLAIDEFAVSVGIKRQSIHKN